MALWAIKRGYWCCSDINLVAAVMVENYIIQNGVIDADSALPPCELAFAYLELIEQKVPKKRRRRGRSGKSRLIYTGPDGVKRARPGETEFKPVVLFAIAPHEGTHKLVTAKKDMWFNGTLFSPPVYGVQHHALMRIVEQLRQEYERKTGRTTTVKNRCFALRFDDGVPRLGDARAELSPEQEVPSVAVRGEEARIGARGIFNP